MSGRILPLPELVRSQLRSGITITSLAQCVEELVLNSLDADATCIAIRVDLDIFRIQVVDNGLGVLQGDLRNLGKRHATSKCHTLVDLNSNLSHYGFRGEALASVIEVAAIVDITSRPHGSTQTFSKLFTYGKEKSVGIAKTVRPSMGTTVTIQDFMYNMPVRRKLIKEAIDIESIRKCLESFALMHPKVSFSLRNDKNNAVVIQTCKSSNTLSTFLQLFGTEKAQGLVEVKHTVDSFTVSGYLSVQPHMTKALQFVYVNKRLVLKTKIHKLVNDLLARTSIISSRLHPSCVGPEKAPSSPTKRMNLYGIFLINIECPYSDYDICLDPAKTLVEFKEWDKLLLCIEEMIIKFAEEENLVISLDERYRRSGRDEEMEEEENSSLSHSSSRLQMFSLKRSGEENDAQEVNSEKYGQAFCTQDNLLAVHSLPVKRVKKTHNKNENFNKDCPYSDNTKNCYIHKEGNESSTCLTVSKSAVHQKMHQEENCSQPSCSLAEVELPLLGGDKVQKGCISKDNCTGYDTAVSEITIDGRFNSLELFKEVVELNNHGNDESVSELDRLIPNCDAATVVEKSLIQRNLERVASSSSENEDCESKFRENLDENVSSLDEFMNFYNADRQKTELESYKTPVQAVQHTPRSPPALRTMKNNLSASEDIDDTSFSVQLSPNFDRSNERKSLSKSLSNRWKKHQSRTKAVQTHQNFAYQWKNMVPKFVGSISGNEKKCIDKDDSGKNSDRIQPDVLHSECVVKANVNRILENKEGTGNLNSIFKFHPVICKKVEHKDSTENFLMGKECGLLDYAHCPSFSTSEIQNLVSLNDERQLLQQKDLVSSNCIDVPENYTTLPEKNSNDGVEHSNKISRQAMESKKSFEKDIVHEKDIVLCQKQRNLTLQTHMRENIRRECDETELNISITDPIKSISEILTNDNLCDISDTLRERSESRKLPKSHEDTCYSPKLSSMPFQSFLGEKDCMNSNKVFISKVNTNDPVSHRDTLIDTDIVYTNSQSIMSAVFTQPFEVEYMAQNDRVCTGSHLHYKGLQANSSNVTQESQGFTPSGGSENLCQDAMQRSADDNSDEIPGYSSIILQKTDDILRNKESIFVSGKGTDTDNRYKQRNISHQRISKEQKRDKRPCHESIRDDTNESHPLSSHITFDCNVNFVHEHLEHFPNENVEKKELQLVTSTFPIGCKNSARDMKNSSNDPSDEEVISASSKSPNSFSESLHFSQLTELDSRETQEGAQMCSMVDCRLNETESTNLSMGSFSFSSSEVMHKAKKQITSCEIVWHGEMIHTGEEDRYENGGKENVDKCCPTDILSSSRNINPYTLSENSETYVISNAEVLSNTPDVSKREEIKKRSSIDVQNYSDDEDIVIHCASNDSCVKLDDSENASNDSEVHVGSRWKEVCDENGRKVYVDIQTGNTLYKPPLLGEAPGWNSSQPLGTPLLKVPLTHDSCYKPVGINVKSRQTFSLSHGFSDLISWKKMRDIKRSLNLKKNSSLGLSLCDKDDGGSGVILEEETKLLAPNVGNSLLPEEQKAIKSVLRDSETDEFTIKWSDKPPTIQQGKSELADITRICQMWEAPHFAMDTDILNSEAQATMAERGRMIRGAMVRVYNIVHPYKFSREMLQSCKVLGQLDKKFIACSIIYPSDNSHECKPSRLVVLFDQHAVHERVRLESIIQENFETRDSGESVIRSSSITPPLEILLPEDEVRLMMAYSNAFFKRGLHFSQISSSKVSFQSIPSCLVASEANEARQKRYQTAGTIVESIIRDMCCTLHQTAGIIGVMPKPLIYVLNSQACRGAVKFGDELTLSQCQELISSLCSCHLPFQCAHGRPSIVPLVNLTHLSAINKKEAKVYLKKIRDAVQGKTTHQS